MSTLLRHALGLVLLVSVVALVESAAAQPAPTPANPAGVVAAHDPPDIPFRRAPMGLSSRSIVVSLATNLHLAFDAQLLRTHTVWEGPPLNLYGPPFTGTATRFICDYPGDRLWGNPPFLEWPGNSEAGFCLPHPTRGGRFRGVSTKGNATTFLYDVITSDGAVIRVHESARMEITDGHTVLVRRFEVGACEVGLELLAHREPG